MRPTSSAVLLLLVVLCSCGDEPLPLEPPVPLGPGETSPFKPANNFNYTSKLTASIQTLKEYEDVLIQWTGLTRDVHGRAIDPVKDIDKVLLLLFPNFKPQEALDRLADDRIIQADLGLYMECVPVKASCRLSKFGLLGSYPGIHNYFNEGRGSWLLVLNRSATKGSLAFSFIDPSSKSTATTATITEKTSALTMNVDFRSLTQLRARADGNTKVEWSTLAKDGLGNPLPLYKLDKITITHYASHTLDYLENHFISIEDLADNQWEADLKGASSVSLLALKKKGSGDAFTGFSKPGLYMLGLQCGSCTNPAPKALTVLKIEK
jgi:hypothetical protein